MNDVPFCVCCDGGVLLPFYHSIDSVLCCLCECYFAAILTSKHWVDSGLLIRRYTGDGPSETADLHRYVDSTCSDLSGSFVSFVLGLC